MQARTTRNALWIELILGTIVFLGMNLVSFAVWQPQTGDTPTNDPPSWLMPGRLTTMAQRSLSAAGFNERTLEKYRQELPTDASIIDQYGNQPKILGLDTCQTYRDTVPAEDRMLGAAGMFSTGTNLVTQLLKQNCVIPERAKLYGENATKEQLGMRWQVRKYSSGSKI